MRRACISTSLVVAVGFLLHPMSMVNAQQDQATRLQSALQGHLGAEAKVTAVRPTAYPGIFEVLMNGREIVYTDGSGQVLIAGPMMDLRTRSNVSERRLEELRKVDFGSLPLDKAIVKVKGKGTRKLAVFSDPDCPFCKRLEPELEKLDDVTIYTFLYPLAALHPDAMRKATLVWCSTDRQRAWDDLMLRGRSPEGGTLACATPILEIIDLAQKLGIEGTPGLVFSDGRVVPGLIPLDEIESRLEAAGRSTSRGG